MASMQGFYANVARYLHSHAHFLAAQTPALVQRIH